MVNYYVLLGVEQNASEDDIRAKLKERKRVWTQRQNAPKPEQQQEASNNLRMVPDIEANLFNSQKRSEYDQKLRTAPAEKSQVDTSKIDANDLIKEGWRLLSIGNVPDALMAATKATEVQGDNPDAWALLGYAHSKWGETEKAIYEYGRAIDKRPNDASFYFDLGGIYEGIEKWQDAMKQYQRATQIDPNTTVYRAAMGSVYIKNEMYEEGIKILEQCINDEPNNEGYKYLLALAYNDSVLSQWTFGRDGSYRACTEESTNIGVDRFKKALALNVDDNELKSLVQNNLEIANWAKEKHWGYNIGGTVKGAGGAIVGGLIAGAIIGGATDFEFLGTITVLGVIALWIKFGFKPGWKINSNMHYQMTGLSK